MADQGAEGLLSPFLRQQRINAVLPYLTGRVLDVGCGTGVLSNYVPSKMYVGFDVDDYSLQSARATYPEYEFVRDLPPIPEKFDTIIALAVIEHMDDPTLFLSALVERMNSSEQSKIVITTPNPVFKGLYRIGARLGIFSRHASDEHKALLNYKNLASFAKQSGLCIQKHHYFLFSANQLVIFRKAKNTDSS
jgi:2-polyprenyl-3-methyl-5-hydroxy-6-metoxy-1,4-benzoquinol methylase